MLNATPLNHSLFNGTFARIATIADGSCFFHSIVTIFNINSSRTCDNLKVLQSYGLQLRKEIITPERWNSFISDRDYKDLAPPFQIVIQPQYHACDFVYNFTAEELGIIIIVLKGMKEIYSTHDLSNPDFANRPVVLLAWIARSHFEPIIEYEQYRNDNEMNYSLLGEYSESNTGDFQGCFSINHPTIQRINRVIQLNKPGRK